MALRLAFLGLSRFAITSAFPDQKDQAVLIPDTTANITDLIHQLEKAEIIPTVLDTFTPKVTLSIFWENATAEVGNTISPSRLQQAPDLQLINHVPDISTSQTRSAMQLTVAMTDPDAPSKDKPDWGEICHWIATDVQLTDIDDARAASGFSEDVTEIMAYKAPGPPPGTGKHRYVLAALAPANGTSEKLNLTVPGDRKHWGYGKKGEGLRKWAEENGLDVIGANFICARNAKQ